MRKGMLGLPSSRRHWQPPRGRTRSSKTQSHDSWNNMRLADRGRDPQMPTLPNPPIPTNPRSAKGDMPVLVREATHLCLVP